MSQKTSGKEHLYSLVTLIYQVPVLVALLSPNKKGTLILSNELSIKSFIPMKLSGELAQLVSLGNDYLIATRGVASYNGEGTKTFEINNTGMTAFSSFNNPKGIATNGDKIYAISSKNGGKLIICDNTGKEISAIENANFEGKPRWSKLIVTDDNIVYTIDQNTKQVCSYQLE